ncbi:hypothetical protein HMPREF1487_06617 [Pseudomonas sp. HPB0071]|nr:hypothetical protein HMPREF1487_06617 [Pseudomonas sp. HPB0071]SHJ53576.1 hypothetical protein SAMN05216295_11657 [Pseudomonas zeshuii]
MWGLSTVSQLQAKYFVSWRLILRSVYCVRLVNS